MPWPKSNTLGRTPGQSSIRSCLFRQEQVPSHSIMTKSIGENVNNLPNQTANVGTGIAQRRAHTSMCAMSLMQCATVLMVFHPLQSIKVYMCKAPWSPETQPTQERIQLLPIEFSCHSSCYLHEGESLSGAWYSQFFIAHLRSVLRY